YAVTMVKNEKSLEVLDKARKLTEDRILDILVPPLKRARKAVEHGGGLEEAVEEADENHITREKFREKLHRGELDHRTVEIDVSASQLPAMQIFGPMNLEEMGVNIQEMFGNILPKKTKRRKISIAEAKVLIEQEEAQKLIDLEAAVKEAVNRVENSGIVF